MYVGINSEQLSQITDISLIERVQHFHVVLLEPGAVWRPPLVVGQKLSVCLSAQLHHLVQLALQALKVGSDLADDLVSIEAEDELRLSPDAVVPGYLGGDVAVDLDDLEEAVLAGEADDVLVGDAALGVPVGAEVDQHVRVLILEQVGVEALQAGEGAQVGVAELGCGSEHIDVNNITNKHQPPHNSSSKQIELIPIVPTRPMQVHLLSLPLMPFSSAKEMNRPPINPPR